jgi:hypothetical protein
MKNVLLISPHSDDILFSASKYLMNRDNYGDIVLFTIENDEKRLKEDAELCELFDMTLIHGEMLLGDKSYYEYYNVLKNKVFDYEEAESCLLNLYGKKFLKELKREIRHYVKRYSSEGYEIVVCLGIGHPMHHFVRKSVEDLADSFYRDFPHSYKRKTQKCYEETCNEFKLDSEFDTTDTNETQFSIAYNIYKTQRSLLFFEKGYMDKKLPEQYYVKIKD